MGKTRPLKPPAHTSVRISKEQASILLDHRRIIAETTERMNVILSTILAGHGIASADPSSIGFTGTAEAPTLTFVKSATANATRAR